MESSFISIPNPGLFGIIISPFSKNNSSLVISFLQATSLFIVSIKVKLGVQAANCNVAAFATGPLGLCGQIGM